MAIKIYSMRFCLKNDQKHFVQKNKNLRDRTTK